VQRRLTVLLVCLVALFAGAASPSRADTATKLPVTPFYEPWMTCSST
jgi:hypothetical protein